MPSGNAVDSQPDPDSDPDPDLDPKPGPISQARPPTILSGRRVELFVGALAARDREPPRGLSRGAGDPRDRRATLNKVQLSVCGRA